MPCISLMLYRSAQGLAETSFRGAKSSMGKVGTTCEGSRGSGKWIFGFWQKYVWMLKYSKCSVCLPHWGYLTKYTGAVVCACVWWGLWGWCWTFYACEYVQDLQIHGGLSKGLAKSGPVYVCMYIFKRKHAYVRRTLKNYRRMYLRENMSQRSLAAAGQWVVNSWSLSLGKWDLTLAARMLRSKHFTALWMASRLSSLPFSTPSFLLQGVVQWICSSGKLKMKLRPCCM